MPEKASGHFAIRSDCRNPLLPSPPNARVLYGNLLAVVDRLTATANESDCPFRTASRLGNKRRISAVFAVLSPLIPPSRGLNSIEYQHTFQQDFQQSFLYYRVPHTTIKTLLKSQLRFNCPCVAAVTRLFGLLRSRDASSFIGPPCVLHVVAVATQSLCIIYRRAEALVRVSQVAS